MKVFFALSLAVCFAGVYCTLELDTKVLEECITENKGDKTIFDEAIKNKKLPEKTPEVTAVVGCVLTKKGLLSEDGQLTTTYKDDETTTPCREITGTDKGEIAYNAVECILKNKATTTTTGTTTKTTDTTTKTTGTTTGTTKTD